MRKVILVIAVLLVAFLACGKKAELGYKTLRAGPDESRPALKEPAYVIDIFVSGDGDREDVEGLAVDVLKEYLAKNPDCKRVRLNVHADSINFGRRRAEIKIGYYGTGVPQVEINRWGS